MAKTQFDIPPELNKQLRIYVLENDLRTREKAILYILKNFLFEFYKVDREGKKWLKNIEQLKNLKFK